MKKLLGVTMFGISLFAASVFTTTAVADGKGRGQGNAQKSPIWSIFKDGTARSVTWKRHKPNPRFAVYNAGTPYDKMDDLVWDRETGLVWQRSPSLSDKQWAAAVEGCRREKTGGRFGWRLPTLSELATLLEDTQLDNLPKGHPFVNVQDDRYNTKTSAEFSPETHNWYVHFGPNFGRPVLGLKTTTDPYWCVRGGSGFDAY